jgi:hypothetical protein
MSASLRALAVSPSLILILGCAAAAQTMPPPLATMPQLAAVAVAPPATEITVRWNLLSSPAADPAAPGAVNEFAVTARRQVDELPVRERDPQLSEDRLVVVAIDAGGREVGWQMVPDPSLLRAETPGPSGQLTGQVLRRTETSFLMTVPETVPPVVELRVLKPRWTGSAFVLDPLGSVAVGR